MLITEILTSENWSDKIGAEAAWRSSLPRLSSRQSEERWSNHDLQRTFSLLNIFDDSAFDQLARTELL